jgi:endonuclease III
MNALLKKRVRKSVPQQFSDWPAPTAAECEEVTERLARLHGRVRRPKQVVARPETDSCGEVPTILDALVRTILSQNTTNKNSRGAMRSFLTRFEGDYEKVRVAKTSEVVDSLRQGGLANIKGKRIKAIVEALFAERGEVSLEHLRPLGDGVGPKTASCVLLFCLGRDSFAVDTHVFRIAKQLGWVPPKATREQTHTHLDARVPKHLQYALHVLLIRHGKSCYRCAAQGRPQQPPLGPCPL